MKYDRNEMLTKFLANEDLILCCKLSKEELKEVNFSKDSGDLLVESLKSLLIAFCNGETDTFTLRQINLKINELSE